MQMCTAAPAASFFLHQKLIQCRNGGIDSSSELLRLSEQTKLKIEHIVH
jgi:hypothetical protein